MPAPRRRRKPNRYHHGELRQVLIEVGLEVLESEGPEKLSLRRITDLVGVTHTAPYNHFPDRKSLLVDLATEGFKILKSHLEKSTASVEEKNSEVFIRSLGKGYLDFAMSHPNLFDLMFSHTVAPLNEHPKLDQASLEVFSLLVGSIEDLMKRNKTRFSESIGEASVSIIAWSICHGLTTLIKHQGLLIERTNAPTANNLLEQASDIFFASFETQYSLVSTDD